MAVRRIAREVRITGRVQGVWFRGWVRQEARRLRLAGWVRNEPDGSVRALFTGPEEAVTEMIALCHQGPPSARVIGIKTQEAALPIGTTDFQIVR